MTKREVFWRSIWSEDGETVAWPSDAADRARLASQIVGAAIVGAAEHVLGASLDRLQGRGPAPGSDDYQKRLGDAHVLATLSSEQRTAVTRLLRETAYFSLYWPMAKIRTPPGVSVKWLTERRDDESSSPETFDLTESLDPHQLLIQWLDEFGELLTAESSSLGSSRDPER
jgi:hypothetical protein